LDGFQSSNNILLCSSVSAQSFWLVYFTRYRFVRTFLESEVTNQKLRTDLYEKMVTLDPTEPTQAEHENAAVTKLRYMQVRYSVVSYYTVYTYWFCLYTLNTSSPSMLILLVHWFTLHTGSPCILVHLVYWFTLYTGSPIYCFTLYTGSPYILVHLVCWFTLYTGSPIGVVWQLLMNVILLLQPFCVTLL